MSMEYDSKYVLNRLEYQAITWVNANLSLKALFDVHLGPLY